MSPNFLLRTTLTLLVAIAIAPAYAADAPTATAKTPATESIVLGGGCFWCLEAVFNELRGVRKVESGYAGGSVANPSYGAVSSGTTGHAEVVRIEFEPAVLKLDDLLRVYFTIHDPTTLNRQGADVGTQYRSVAFYSTPAQQAAITRIRDEVIASGEWKNPLVTEIKPLAAFYAAEDYHKEYFALHGEEPYCQLVIAPKVAKFRKHFRALLKTTG
jgi:peptide-methionine (S)-S-oxide reductase